MSKHMARDLHDEQTSDWAQPQRGRPRIHRDAKARLAAHRREHRRVEASLESSASWRLKALAKAWGCSQSAAIERLILEADERYEDILFPET